MSVSSTDPLTIDKFQHFWKGQPALLIGFYLLISGSLALNFHPILLLPLCLLPWISPLKYVVVPLIFFIYVSYLYPPSHVPNIEGKAYVSLNSLKKESSPFQQSYTYTGIVKNITTHSGMQTCHIPCKIYRSLKDERPLATHDYYIEGSFLDNRFKASKMAPWERVPNTFSLAEWRFQAKEAFRSYLKKHLPHSRVAAFLSTLATGDIDERALSMEFSQLGLQHILAISGFHFGLLALFLKWLLRPFLSLKAIAAILLLLLSLYFLFVGNSPSVLRAWIALIVVLCGSLGNLRSSGLNTLGIGLSVELLLNPLLMQQIGFQLSFSATLAIILLYKPIHQLLKKFLPERPLENLASMSFLQQHGYLCSAFIRKSLALNFAVHLLTLPILLFLFSKFPCLSLLYNLFFPICVGISLFLLLLSLIFPFLHALNNIYTSFILEMTAHPPACFNYSIYCQKFPFSLLILFITISVLGGIALQIKMDKQA